MIKGYSGKFAETIHKGRAAPKGFPADLVGVARRKRVMVNNAAELGDLARPPGNCLEELKFDRPGYHSIRINDQWRVEFRWTAAGPEEVEITKHHAKAK